MELSEPDVKKWESAAEKASRASNDIIILDDLGRCTVDRVYAEASRWKPDLLAVDYISLLTAPKSAGNQVWERVTYITRELKLLARTLRVPIIGIAQTNIGGASDGATLENIAYSRSVGQDSDLVFGLKDDKEMRANNKMVVRMLKNRDGRLCETEMLWNMERMDFREWKGQVDLFGAKQP
jgi:replicative DNA helicase